MYKCRGRLAQLWDDQGCCNPIWGQAYLLEDFNFLADAQNAARAEVEAMLLMHWSALYSRDHITFARL